MSSAAQEEVDKNFDAFMSMLPWLLSTHRDKYALMKGQKVLGFYSTAEDARVAAESFIPDKIYSIQHVTEFARSASHSIRSGLT